LSERFSGPDEELFGRFSACSYRPINLRCCWRSHSERNRHNLRNVRKIRKIEMAGRVHQARACHSSFKLPSWTQA
jgi:hypothetical protein